MTQTSKPDPQQVRDWLRDRQSNPEPPPTPERIREQLGWNLIQAERDQAKERE